MEFKSSWKLIYVCYDCLSKNIKGTYNQHCGNCGRSGGQAVLMRKVRILNSHFPFIKTKKEYKQYENYVNPFERKIK